MSGPLSRIALRYLSAFLVAKGMLSPEMGGMLGSDADVIAVVEVAIGTGMGLAAEGWFLLAKKYGWAT